jgi:toxin FitB
MIILDTNVLSELLRPSPEARVMAWLDEQPRASLFTSAVTQGEILYGIRLIP